MGTYIDRIERVVILGCGPAGLFAAHAATMAGRQVQIFSKRRRSEMYGAQYLHSPIPGLTTTEPVDITYTLIGTSEGYASRVYGDERPAFVSPETLTGVRPGWDIRDAYYRAWDLYNHLIEDTPDITGGELMGFGFHRRLSVVRAFSDYPRTKVISTIPLTKMCIVPQVHKFRANKIWAKGDAPERGISVECAAHPNSIIYNGDPEAGSWVRASNLFGYRSMEWPWNEGARPPIEGVTEVAKVMDTDCNCFLPKMWRAGRFGTWDKSVLADSAFDMIFSALTGTLVS